jgi:hypothetical protein
MSIQRKPVNYLNNRDMLKEIHLSKNSYCSYASPLDHQYDMIIDRDSNADHQGNIAMIFDPAVIQQARETHAARNSDATNKIDPATVPVTDLIFRVMTWEHVPIAPKQPRKSAKKKTAREIFEFEDEEEPTFDDLEDPKLSEEMGMADMVHVRVNFPPFQHFRITDQNTALCVGKSHWQGDLYTGEFCRDHGQITNKLAKMYLMLCDRYALRYNWRGYTYKDEMIASAVLQLTYVGLRFNEAKSSNPFAYYTAAISNSFCRVLNSEKRVQNIRDDILELNGLNPSWSRQNTSSGVYEE